jgi:AcrR family transcriptional regulator
MLGLRERQKEDRRSRIIAAAKELFAESGLENITIEAIADIAGVSSVTVHNYYGTKSGVLLGMVAESDRELLDRLDSDLVGKANDLTDLVLRFFSIVCAHTQTHLDKAIWRQVIAASVSDSEQKFGTRYHELDDRLALVLVREINAMMVAGKLPAEANPSHLGRALFNLQNARFIQFVTTDEMTEAEVTRHLRNDLTALLPIARA